MDDARRSITSAPLPTGQTLRRRKSLIFQVWRFAALNLRMLTMITKGSHQPRKRLSAGWLDKKSGS